MQQDSSIRLKHCRKCGEDKPPEAFHRNKSKGDGLSSYCASCYRGYAKDRREANPDYFRDWAAAHPGYNAEKCKRWQQQNPDYAVNRVRPSREEERERKQRWRKTNPEKKKAIDAKRRALKSGTPGEYTADEVWAMYEDQGGLCAYCETVLFGSYHVDHITPLVRGGRNDWTNLAIVCPRCNHSKGTKSAEEFCQRLYQGMSVGK